LNTIILDAAMGTRLLELGHTLEAPFWSAAVLDDDPEAVAAVHCENIEAGAHVLTTNTFRTTPYVFHEAGFNGVEAHNRARALTLLAIRLAWKCIKESGQELRIAGSIAPLADCYKPEDYPGNIIARPWHDAQLDNLDHQATDILLLETMNSAREARLLVELALRREKEIWVSFVLNEEAQIFNGDDLISTAIDLERLGIDAIGVNCSSPDLSLKALGKLREAVDLPLVVYPNLGKSSRTDGELKTSLTPKQFVEWTETATQAGAQIIGACCGSNHTHIEALAAAIPEPEEVDS